MVEGIILGIGIGIGLLIVKLLQGAIGAGAVIGKANREDGQGVDQLNAGPDDSTLERARQHEEEIERLAGEVERQRAQREALNDVREEMANLPEKDGPEVERAYLAGVEERLGRRLRRR